MAIASSTLHHHSPPWSPSTRAMPPAQLPMHHPRSSSTSKKSPSSSSSSSTSGSANQTAAVADLGNALLASFLVPFAPSLLDRRLNVGFFHESDTPYWWALTLLAFWSGQHSACWVRRRAGSWHWFMTRPPLRRATQVQLVCLVVLLLAVLSTGWATRVELLMVSRWLTGFSSVFLWGHAMEKKTEGSRGGGGGGAGMHAAAGGAGRWSNNRILVPSSSSSSGTLVSPLLNPMQALGWVVGGLVGGLSYSTRMFVVVGGLPAMVPSIIVAVLVFLLACLVLRRMRKEVEGVGGRKYYKQEQQHEQQQQQQLGGGGGSGRDALTEAGMSLPSPGTAARRNNNHNTSSTSSFPSVPSSSLPPSLPPPPPPPTFLQAAGGDYTKAHAHYHAHLRWRKEEGVDEILSQPHPTFDAIKQHYPHFVHGRGKKNEIVIYEYPGKMDLRELKKLGVGVEEIARHYIFFNEYLYRRLSGGRVRTEEGREGGREDGDEGRVMTVLDIGGLGLGSLNKDVVEVLRTTSHLLHHHYPSRVVRIVVVNVPFFIGGAWKILASVLPQQVQEKIELSSNPEVDLLKYIERENIPREYGGGSKVKMGESEEEKWLKELVREGGRTRGRTGGRSGGKEGEEEGKASSSWPPPTRNSLPPKISMTFTPSSSSNNSSSSSSSTTTSWLPSWMRSAPSFLPLRKGPSPKHAHLGYENKFVFDKTRRVWVLREEEGEEDEEEGEEEETLLLPGKKDEGGREEGEEEEEEVPPLPETEEDGLVLAIQAAHYAEQLSREGKTSPSSLPSSSSSSSSVLLPTALQHYPGAQQHQQQTLSARVAWRENAAASAALTATSGLAPSRGANTDADLEWGSAAGNPSAASSSSSSSPSPLLLQTTVLSLLLSLLQHALLPMLPIWLAIPHSIGGLSLSPSLLGLLLSFGTTATFLAHAYALPPSLLRLPSSNPLQAFRLAVIVFVSCTVLMSGLHPQVTSLPSSSSSSFSIVVGFQHFVAGIFYLFLLLLLVSSLFFARAASTTLLHLVFLPPSFPPFLPFLLSCTEVVGPVVGAWVLSWSVAAAGVGMKYPMDGRLMWHVSALVLVGLYMMTLQLQVVLKGDWGAMRLEEGGGEGGGFVFLGKRRMKKGRKKKGRRSSSGGGV